MAVLSLVLASCASPSAVLVDDRGNRVVCRERGIGIIGSTLATQRYEDCMAEARKRGYRLERQ
jgi:hypothetical protein